MMKFFNLKFQVSYTNFDVVNFGFSAYDRPANDRGEGVRWKIVTSETAFHELGGEWKDGYFRSRDLHFEFQILTC